MDATISSTSPIWRDEPAALDVAHLPRRDFPRSANGRKGEFPIVVRQTVLNRIRTHGRDTSDVCGVLVGEVLRDDASPYLMVEAALETGEEALTAENWRQIQSDVKRKYPKLQIVGWYLTHPGLGVFVTEADRVAHQQFFGQKWQLGLVHDPRRDELGIFSTIAGSLRRTDFSVIPDELELATYLMPDPDSAEGKKAKVKRKRRYPILQVMATLIALGMFALLGFLFAMFIKELHITPHWPFRLES